MSGRRWVNYAAAIWAVAFGMPHAWWALGWSFGFPGGPDNYRMWMASWWRYLYDVVVVLLSVLGAVVALGLLRIPNRTRARRLYRILAWIAGVLLTLRGAAGMIVDGTADPIWWPTFLTGGVLFVTLAWRSRGSTTVVP